MNFSCWPIRSAEANPFRIRHFESDVILKHGHATTCTQAKPYSETRELPSPNQSSAFPSNLLMKQRISGPGSGGKCRTPASF